MDQSRSAVPATIEPFPGAMPEAGIRRVVSVAATYRLDW